MVGATEVANTLGQRIVMSSEKRGRRKRLRLSCDECRKKKLSCDRNLPCQRCLRSGRPELCSFETGNGKLGGLSGQQQAQHTTDDIRDLRAEVFQLKEMLSKAELQHESAAPVADPVLVHNAEPGPVVVPLEAVEIRSPANDNRELSDPRHRSPRAYYNQHALFKFFMEIPQLFPMIKETAAEWLQPLGVHLKKGKLERAEWTTSDISNGAMENLLPPKADTDTLVFFYLSHFEQVHRIVHVPTFKRSYTQFWAPEQRPESAMIALVLSMISISACTISSSTCSTLMPTVYRATAVKWIAACDEWLKQQSSKHGKLMQYQVSCLLYLAKRVNIIRKKRFWKESGGLVQNAILDGLYSDVSSAIETSYLKEMKRRIWVVVRELDLQNAFEYGLPTLLYNISSDIAPPANIDDNEFDEDSKELPKSKPPIQYTSTSYQYHSSRNWNLRLEIARRLSSTEPSKRPTYEDVLRYTHEITQATHSLPSWDTNEHSREDDGGIPILAYAYLRFQLGECILALHRPYLQKDKGEFLISGNLCYNVARDILLLNTKLATMGLESVVVLREDLFTAALSITHITMQQLPNSTSIIMANLESMIELLAQCLPLIEERYLRCFYGEPWCVLTMSASLMLLKVQIGKETWQSAKVACAQRFLDLYYKNIGRQQTSLLNQQQVTPRMESSHLDALDPCQPSPSLGPPVSSGPDWQENTYFHFGADFFEFEMDFDESWENWGSV